MAMLEKAPDNGYNRVTPYLNPGKPEDPIEALRMEILEDEVELAFIGAEIKDRMWEAINEAAKKDVFFADKLAERKAIEFQAEVTGASADNDPELKKINTSLVMGLNTIGLHGKLQELIEQRNRVRKQMKVNVKKMKNLRAGKPVA